MGKKLMGDLVWTIGMVVLALTATSATAAVGSCVDVVPKLFPCEQYLVGNSAQLTAKCCAGAQALDKLASASQADRQAICKCLKNAAQSLPILQGRAQQIPPLCQLTTNLKIDPNIDCTNI